MDRPRSHRSSASIGRPGPSDAHESMWSTTGNVTFLICPEQNRDSRSQRIFLNTLERALTHTVRFFWFVRRSDVTSRTAGKPTDGTTLSLFRQSPYVTVSPIVVRHCFANRRTSLFRQSSYVTVSPIVVRHCFANRRTSLFRQSSSA